MYHANKITRWITSQHLSSWSFEAEACLVFFVKVTKTDGRGLERDRGANQNAKKTINKLENVQLDLLKVYLLTRLIWAWGKQKLFTKIVRWVNSSHWYDNSDMIILIRSYWYDHFYSYKLSKAFTLTSVLNDSSKGYQGPGMVIFWYHHLDMIILVWSY